MKLLEELRIVGVRGYVVHAGKCVVKNWSTNKAFSQGISQRPFLGDE